MSELKQQIDCLEKESTRLKQTLPAGNQPPKARAVENAWMVGLATLV